MTNITDGDLLLKNITAQAPFPICFADLEKAVAEKIEAGPFGYIRSGAGGEQTLRNNRAAFEKYSIVPRFLKDVSNVQTSINLFGKTYPTPLLFAPVGMNGMVHDEGELAVVRAAEHLNMPYIQSTVSTYALEEVAQAAPSATKWFQLYWSTNEEIAFSMVARAEAAGFEAIVLTVDTVMLGWREEDVRNQFSPLKLGYARGNYMNDPVFTATLPDDSFESYVQGVLQNVFHPTLNWAHVRELKKRTNLPILLKGILHPEDAKLAIDNGIDGIIVSNHGGRQLDGVIGSLDALPAIAKVVNGQIPIILDSGVYRGMDALKALALGADAVAIGRPFVYGLALEGQQGVEKVMTNLYDELKVSIALAGATSVKGLRNITLVKHDGTEVR
ncbi:MULTISPECIES: alpha-hydroxy acid oxidase [Lysinibacillus]|uniref:alpha-hydroxy acid oxidase n=1 Tax=Lysinibacillus TaxID=400634 RepID=UPI0007385706|nr:MULTISPECIES: alpha-hydroxy acid oxidase [unclassified Lysinibacillus]MEE3807709.1 alpha-hydroxy acid oxidase [Lysinibacillus fusiformis]KUF35953.1 lactate 2-monooxygenase [Lysinibacillus sp. F5]SCY51233.1 FMN-dependent dehydrogenase, includes L-lactate dehydrogenase and type II isopentenyl diphosphate isomerase [Lysinibacillus sp. SG9]SDB22439.1 FMN-dependent dehydrogenase, includes L-lactate dehydrogenase and type II isopentenyl diphosphate isomerase [Lysinibacillus sp. TC-37]SFS72337.1 F